VILIGCQNVVSVVVSVVVNGPGQVNFCMLGWRSRARFFLVGVGVRVEVSVLPGSVAEWVVSLFMSRLVIILAWRMLNCMRTRKQMLACCFLECGRVFCCAWHSQD